MALLFAIVAVTGFSVKLLKAERRALEESLRDSQAKAIALLSNRVEQTIVSATRKPFLAVKNIPATQFQQDYFLPLFASFPEIEQVTLFDDKLRIVLNAAKSENKRQEKIEKLIMQRLSVEGLERKLGPFGMYTFVESIDDVPWFFRIESLSDAAPQSGWALLRFNLGSLAQRYLEPLLSEFARDQQGNVSLQNPSAAWDDDALNWPIGRLLPGWMLVFRPDPDAEKNRESREQRILLGITVGLVLALVLAGFAAVREVVREHALVELRDGFVANVSHELRAPLTLIRMYAETLHLQRVRDPERIQHYHSTILREAERLANMIDNVLDFSRLRHGNKIYELSSTDLGATVSSIVTDYAPSLEERGTKLNLSISDNLPPVAHDSNGIRQVLVNLLDNAEKYGGTGVTVNVSVTTDSDGIRMRVEDNGPGVPTDELDRIVHPFERGSKSHPVTGSGLGLYLVAQIAKAHNAEFRLEHADGTSGLRATLLFPLSARQ